MLSRFSQEFAPKGSSNKSENQPAAELLGAADLPAPRCCRPSSLCTAVRTTVAQGHRRARPASRSAERGGERSSSVRCTLQQSDGAAAQRKFSPGRTRSSAVPPLGEVACLLLPLLQGGTGEPKYGDAPPAPLSRTRPLCTAATAWLNTPIPLPPSALHSCPLAPTTRCPAVPRPLDPPSLCSRPLQPPGPVRTARSGGAALGGAELRAVRRWP